MDVIRLPPLFRAFLNRPGREAGRKRVRRNLLAPEPVQGDAEVAQLQRAVRAHEHVPRSDISMNRSTLMDHPDPAQQMNDLPARPRLRPGLRIPIEVALEVALC